MSAPLTRRLAAACLIASGAVVAISLLDRPAGVPVSAVDANLAGGGLDDAGYLEITDRLQVPLRALWSERLQRYDPGPGATVSEVNADLLLVHAAAARARHRGPARDDRRARAAARFLTGPEIWHDGPHPGWWASPELARQHVVFEAEVAEGLAAAYRARRALGLDASTTRLIRRQLATVVASPDWRWPALVMNQLNWYATVFAADATVNGTGPALADTLARHLAHFTSQAGSRGAVPGNFGAGLRFHYQPARWPHARMNFDSPEYANIVLGFSRSYGQARAAGMPRPRQLNLLREWVRRVLSGYWTHAGYLNWDTGLGFSRWHQRKKVGLAQGALIGIASEPDLQPSPRWGAWPKWMLDEGLRNYVALTERIRQLPAGLAYGVNEIPQGRPMAALAAARESANAMRALQAGLGRRPAAPPPALYSFDPDTGRLAVTTPAYNTAIVAINHGAQPYGGLDLARLFDGRQEVAANIGGVNTEAFGLRVRSHAGRTLLRTQYGARQQEPGATPLELVRAPRGAGARASTRELRAYAGPFTDLRVRGRVSAGALQATCEYRFTPVAIEGRWTVTGRGGVTGVTFPSWGRHARITAMLRDGRTVAIAQRPVPLAGIRSLHVDSARSGYRIVPLDRQRDAAVRLIPSRPQSSQPDPGPTLEVMLGAAPARFAARIVVDPS